MYRRPKIYLNDSKRAEDQQLIDKAWDLGFSYNSDGEKHLPGIKNPFLQYCKHEQDRIRVNGKISKKYAGELWTAMSDREKQPYKDM